MLFDDSVDCEDWLFVLVDIKPFTSIDGFGNRGDVDDDAGESPLVSFVVCLLVVSC